MKDSSNTINSLAHTKWNCKYHIVFAPKYRTKYSGLYFASKQTLLSVQRRKRRRTFRSVVSPFPTKSCYAIFCGSPQSNKIFACRFTAVTFWLVSRSRRSDCFYLAHNFPPNFLFFYLFLRCKAVGR